MHLLVSTLFSYILSSAASSFFIPRIRTYVRARDLNHIGLKYSVDTVAAYLFRRAMFVKQKVRVFDSGLTVSGRLLIIESTRNLSFQLYESKMYKIKEYF
jgi:hypothetical protein